MVAFELLVTLIVGYIDRIGFKERQDLRWGFSSVLKCVKCGRTGGKEYIKKCGLNIKNWTGKYVCRDCFREIKNL